MPQVRGMYNGDRARKQMLVDYGFRLPSALDNRPLRLEEFEKHVNRSFMSLRRQDHMNMNKQIPLSNKSSVRQGCLTQ